MNPQNENLLSAPKSNPNPETEIQNSTKSLLDESEKSEPEFVHFVGNIEVHTPVLDELVGRLVTVYPSDSGNLRMKFDSEFLPETLEPIVEAMRNISSHDVMQVHAALTEKNVFLRKGSSCWALRGFIIAVTEARYGVDGVHELNFPDWDVATFAWDNGTITINVDGNVGTLTNCGPYAKLMLTRLAPDMHDDQKTIGLFVYDKFVFGFRVEEPDVCAQMRVRLDRTEIDWSINDEDWKISD